MWHLMSKVTGIGFYLSNCNDYIVQIFFNFLNSKSFFYGILQESQPNENVTFVHMLKLQN